MPMTRAPDDITLANLQVVVMPNGEILCLGRLIGWVDRYGSLLEPVATVTGILGDVLTPPPDQDLG